MLRLITTVVALLLPAVYSYAAGLARDAEAASHGDEAAQVELVKETELKGDLIFRQYNLAVLSHYSYMLASAGEAMIIDPARDIDRYLKDAKELGLKITKVYLTHSHADFVAGHMELAKATGAEILINELTGALYKHRPLKDKDEIRLGSARCVILTTPGHTPDGTCMLVYTSASGGKPSFMFTGDTLFIGSVGRPDLMGEGMSAASLAEMGFYTWQNKLSKIPDDVRIFPAHGAGSLCGAHLSDKPVSTLGEQKKENVYLQNKDLTSYVMAVINGLPDAPQYFKHNAKMNHDGPPLVDWENVMPPALAPAKALAQTDKSGWLLDVRDAAQFSAAHPKNAINIGIRGRLETWTGIMIPWGEPFVLVGSDKEAREAAFRLKRIGYDAPAGFLKGGVEAWKQAGLATGSLKLVKPVDLHQQMTAGTAPVIVDVRLPNEWMALRIGNVLNIPVNKIFSEGKRLSVDMPVLTVCNSAYRSSMSASALLKMGYKDVRNMEGGGEAWIEAGLPTISPAGSGQGTALRSVKLPDRLSAQELKRMIMDLPGTFELIDIRPPAQFQDFNIPGAVNVDIADFLSSPAYINGSVPLVIIDRDGSIGMAAGGIISQKTSRPVKVLYGGLEAYWKESSTPIQASGVGAPPPAPAVKPAAPPAAQPPAPAAPQAPKKKSAGC